MMKTDFLLALTWTTFCVILRTPLGRSVSLGTSHASCSVRPARFSGQRSLCQTGSFLDTEGLYDIRNSRTWTEDDNEHLWPQKSDFWLQWNTAPTPARFEGITISTFVKHACQSLIHSLDNQPDANTAQLATPVTAALYGGSVLEKLFRMTIDLRVDIPKGDRPLLSSLRGLLVQELRGLIKDSTKPWCSSLTSFYQREAADRFRLSARFLGALENLRAEFEWRMVLQVAAGKSVGGGAGRVVLIDVLKEFPTLLLEDSVVSSRLQNFIARVMQYPRFQVVMQRQALERTLYLHLQVPRPDRQLLREVFAHISGPEELFSDAAKSFVVDMLKLTAVFYNEHSRQLLGILESDDEAVQFFSSRLTSRATTHKGTADHFSLDVYGFASALNLISWQADKEYESAAVLQSSCRFVYAAGLSKLLAVSPNRQRTATLASTRFLTPFIRTDAPSETFTVHDGLSPLHVYKQLSAWRGMDAPSERVRIYQLNAAEARSLRATILGRTVRHSPSDTKQVLHGPSDKELTALLRKAFERAITCFNSPLRTLLNMELDQLLRSGSVTPRSSLFSETLPKRLNALVSLQRNEAVRQFKTALANLVQDANNKLEAFFDGDNLIEKVLDTPFYYPQAMLDHFLSIASIPELGNVKFALAVSSPGFKAAQAYFFKHPLARLTLTRSKHLKLYRRTGAQKCLRTSIISRLNHVVRLGLKVSERFFDTKLDLLSAQDLNDLRAGILTVAGQHALSIVPPSPDKPAAEEMNFYGFLSATILTAYSELLRTPIALLDASDRLFFVTHVDAHKRPQFLISTQRGSIKGLWNPRLANLVQQAERKAYKFMNLTFCGAGGQDLREPALSRAKKWFKRFASGLSATYTAGAKRPLTAQQAHLLSLRSPWVSRFEVLSRTRGSLLPYGHIRVHPHGTDWQLLPQN